MCATDRESISKANAKAKAKDKSRRRSINEKGEVAETVAEAVHIFTGGKQDTSARGQHGIEPSHIWLLCAMRLKQFRAGRGHKNYLTCKSRRSQQGEARGRSSNSAE